MSALQPPVEALVDLLVRMTELDWPTTEPERLTFFGALDLHDAGTWPRSSRPVAESENHRFMSRLPGGVQGSATTFRGELLGLSLFAYDEPVEDGERARLGYAGIRDGLVRRLGLPVEEWGSEREPASLWRPGELMIEMYCFQRLRSGVMVGPSHAKRSAELDATVGAGDPDAGRDG